MHTPHKSECPAATGHDANDATENKPSVLIARHHGNAPAFIEATPISIVLSRLDKVRQRQPGQWSACCPAHDDTSPSLSVRETPEGAVLLHCFAGCDVGEVVNAIGLELHDLFPPETRYANAPKKLAKVLTAEQGLELLHDQTQFLAIYYANRDSGASVTDEDISLAHKATGRIALIHLAAKS